MNATYKITITNPNTNIVQTFISSIVNPFKAINAAVKRVEDNTPIGDLPRRGDWKVTATSRFTRH